MSKPPVKKLLWISLVFLLMAFLVIYYKLGGFNPVTMELVQVNNYQLAGKYFQGSFQSDTIRVYFNEMRLLVQQGTLKGQPVIIYDQEPDGSRGFSRSFVGVLLLEDQAVPTDFKKREIDAANAIRVSKDAHISVMPNPHKIAKKVKRFCQKQDVQPLGPSIEIYLSYNRLVIEQPVYSMSE